MGGSCSTGMLLRHYPCLLTVETAFAKREKKVYGVPKIRKAKDITPLGANPNSSRAFCDSV